MPTLQTMAEELKMCKYKWQNPLEWLIDCIENEEDRQLLLPLLQQIDFDTIQDTYQTEMENDGYFEVLDCEN